jgi:hypothetical protein
MDCAEAIFIGAVSPAMLPTAQGGLHRKHSRR